MLSVAGGNALGMQFDEERRRFHEETINFALAADSGPISAWLCSSSKCSRGLWANAHGPYLRTSCDWLVHSPPD